MPFRPLALATACALALPGLVHAQSTGTSAPTGRATELDEIIVTATRTATTTDAALAAVEVIDRAAIERSQARSLPDLLRGRAGISLANQGGAGKLTTLFLRGSESDHVLVLVDGVRIGSSTSGLAAFQDLPIEMIDRVEIVRGPRSSLYGSDAIGGVIQIFTRRDQHGFTPRLHAGGGSNGLHEFGLGFGGRGSRSWFGGDYSYRKTDGINACRGIGAPVYAGCFTTQPDRDGYRSDALSLRGGVQWGDAWVLDGHALRNEGHNEFDGDYVNEADTIQQVVGAALAWTPAAGTAIKLSAGRNRDASDNLKDGAFIGYFDTDRDSATLQGDFTVAPGQLLTLGLDWLRDSVDSNTRFAQIQRDNRAAFGSYQAALGAQSLQASVRHDDNEQFGDHTTGNAAWGIGFGESWRVTAGYGTAFKAPSFNELYFPFFGNPDLRPEQSATSELGLAWQRAASSIRLDAYDTRVDDLIAYDSALRLPNNIQRARLRGAELTAHTTVAQWALQASASVVDAVNSDAPNAGKQLPRRARHSARLDLDRGFGAWRLGLTGVGEGERFDDLANRRRLGSYATLDLRAEYSLTPSVTVQARLANVLDRKYETSAFYNQPGREWFVTVRYAPAN